MPYPSPSQGKWRMGCSCGHRIELPCAGLRDTADRDARLNALWIEHVPEAERLRYVLVDQRPGHEGVWLMPIGTAVLMRTFYDQKGIFHAILDDDRVFPIAEIRTVTGQVLRTE